MENSKRKSNGKRLLSVLLAAMLIGSATVATSSYTGVGISASAVSDTEETSASDFEYSTNDDGTVTITGYNGSDTEITIPSEIDGKSVTEIGEDAFSGCDKITNVIIPDSVTIIGRSAFNGCDGLTNITIPDNVTYLGEVYAKSASALSECKNLTNVTVSENNKTYSSQDGVLFNKDKTELIMCPRGKSGIYEIPDSVNLIRMAAFQDCQELTGITIPDSVTTIDTWAFMRCMKLKSVTIPDSVTLINYMAFGYSKIDQSSIDDFTIYGVKNSAAETYAKENKMKFVAINEPIVEPSEEPSKEPSTEPSSNPEQSSKDEPSKTTENSSTQQTSENTGTADTSNTDVPKTADSVLPAFMVALFATISGITAVIFSKRKKSEQ